MTPFYRIKATGETTGGLISAWEAATVGEKEDALLERSEPPPMGVSSGVSGGSIAEAIESVPLSLVFPPGTPSWPPPGARANTPRVSEFTVSTSQPTSPASPAGNASDVCQLPCNLRLEVLPQEVLSRICAISVTNDSTTRPTLQATSSFLFHTLRATPDAWDTFEVMTGTRRCLKTPSQVAEYVERSGVRPLSVALTVQNEQPENVQAIIECVVEAASRIEDLILDVHCGTSEHPLIRLFSPPIPNATHQSILRRLALVGNLQLDYILSSLSLLTLSPIALTHHHPLTQPVFSSLKHLTIAYCPIYSLDTTMNTVESLKLGVTFLAPQPSGGSLVGLLRAFPSLRKVEIQTLAYMPGYDPRICERDSNGSNVVLQWDHLEHLVLDSIPLDCELFASLRCPHVRKLVLKEVQPDSTDEALAASGAAGEWDVMQRFDEFVARHNWDRLEVLDVDRVYEQVAVTCIELVKMVEGRLKELTLGGFAWDTCKSLMTPCDLLTPVAVGPPTPPIGVVIDAPKHLPTLESLVIRLNDTESHLARQAWMDGLQQFSLGRIAYDTIVDVLFRGYQHAPAWLQVLGKKTPGWRLTHGDGPSHHPSQSAEASTRTLTHISLETSFNDSYAFIWNDYEHLRDIYDPSV